MADTVITTFQQGATGPAGGNIGQLAATLVNGLNSNVGITGLSLLRLTGPSAAFSLGGFASTPAPVGGQPLSVINTTSQPVTIVHEDASSTAANRINTLSGKPIVLAPKSSAVEFRYDGVGLRWVLVSTGPKQISSYDLKDFGAVGDGVTDDTAAFIAAIAACIANNVGILVVPPGLYLITAQLTIAAAVMICGALASGSPGGINAIANAFPTILHNFSGDLFVFNGANGIVAGSGGGLDGLRIVQAFGGAGDGIPRGRAVKLTAVDTSHKSAWVRLSRLVIEEGGKSPWTWAIDIDGSPANGNLTSNYRISEVSTHTGAGATGAIRLFSTTSVKMVACELHDTQGHILIDGTAGNETVGVQIVGGDGQNITIDHAGTVSVTGGTYKAITVTANTLVDNNFMPGHIDTAFSDTSGTQASGCFWYDGFNMDTGGWRTSKPIVLPVDVPIQGLNGSHILRNLIRYDAHLGAVQLADDNQDVVTLGTMPGSLGNAANSGSLILQNGSRIMFVKSDASQANRAIEVIATDKLRLGIDMTEIDFSGGASTQLIQNATGLGFFGATPVAQPARVGQLTDSTTGTSSTTIGDVGNAFSQSTLNNIHASLLAKINSLETTLHNLHLTA